MKSMALTMLLAAGCSLIGVRGPQSPRRDSRTVECTDGHVVPALDVVVGMLGISGGGALVLAFGRDRAGDFLVNTGTVAAVVGALHLVSGIAGAHVVGTCRRAKNRFAAEVIAARAERAAQGRKRQDAWVLTKQATAAAMSGDCETVKRLGLMVRTYDAAFHRTVFVLDVAIGRCLEPVQP